MRVKLTHITLIAFILLIGSHSAIAQWDTTWIKTYGGNRHDQAFDMVKSNDTGFVMIGSTSSFGFDNSQLYFLKVDSIGDIVWSKSHGGTGQEWGQSIIKTSDGGYLAVGYTNSWGAGGFDVFIVKLDENGNLEYEAVNGGSDWDFANDVIEISPGKFVIAGETYSYGNGDLDGWLMQFDEATRTFDWETTVGTSQLERLNAVAKGNNNNFFAVGEGKAPGKTDTDIMVVKFNSNGDSLWTKFFGDSLLDFGNDIIKMSDGTFAMTGVRTIPTFFPGAAVLRIDSIGGVIFDYAWNNPIFPHAEGKKLLELSNQRLGIISTTVFNDDNSDFWLAYSKPNSQYFETGSTHGSLSYEEGHAIVDLEAGGFGIAGFTEGYNNFYTNVVMIKTDSNALIYSKDFENITDSINVVGIEKVENLQPKILYNQNTGEISIISEQKDFNYEVFDLTGKKIFSGLIVSNQPKLILPTNHTPGLYLFVARSNSESINKMLFIK